MAARDDALAAPPPLLLSPEPDDGEDPTATVRSPGADARFAGPTPGSGPAFGGRPALAALLGAPEQAHRLEPEARDDAVTAVLADAFAFHYQRNGFFRAQCEAAGVSPADVGASKADLARIPLLPAQMFKQADAHVLLSVPLDRIELEIRSTGTVGVPSVARRDGETVSRAALAILGQYRDLFGLSHGAGLFLCPSPAEAPEMGMVKVLNVLNGLFDDHAYAVRDYAFDPREALDHLDRWDGRMTRHVVGPPFLVNRLLRHLEAEDLAVKLDPDSLVITLGGWKRYTGQWISRQAFNARMERRLGVPAENVRDMYGLIESNMLAVECAEHRKHVPPWSHVSIRDVTDLTVELPPGRTGAIAILDALSGSYPGFILTEDIGDVDESPCPCGRTGPTVSMRRRAHGAELGCCAVSIDAFIEARELTADCEVAPTPSSAVTTA